jgi:PDZ domain-containing protein
LTLRRLLSPGRLALVALSMILIALVSLWLVPSNTYIFLPDRARPVDPLISVQGGHDDKTGGIYFVDIFVRKATWIERLWPGIHEGAELVPKSTVLPPGVSEKQRQRADLREMTRSQSVAAAVALRAAGYKVVAKPTGVLVEQVAGDVPAAGKLLPTDVILEVNGKAVREPSALRREIGRLHPGDPVHLTVRRGSELKQIVVRTVPDPAHPSRPIIGVIVSQAASIKLPIRVKINAGNIGGPSAGLAFALDILDQLKDIDHGQRVAATGAIELDGTVSPIGGVRQKTIGVRRSGIRTFLVPAGENAAEARRYAKGIRIVPVYSFRQALRALATLSKKS